MRYGLSVGATCAPLVLVMMFILGMQISYKMPFFNIFWFFPYGSAPLAYPIAKILDYVLGDDQHHLYKKAELKSFLQFHKVAEEPLRDEEIAILNGVLELNTKNVETIMTPLRVSCALGFHFT